MALACVLCAVQEEHRLPRTREAMYRQVVRMKTPIRNCFVVKRPGPPSVFCSKVSVVFSSTCQTWQIALNRTGEARERGKYRSKYGTLSTLEYAGYAEYAECDVE